MVAYDTTLSPYILKLRCLVKQNPSVKPLIYFSKELKNTAISGQRNEGKFIEIRPSNCLQFSQRLQIPSQLSDLCVISSENSASGRIPSTHIHYTIYIVKMCKRLYSNCAFLIFTVQ
jgi:hypothetical protein